MTMRTIKQQGQLYGLGPATVIAKIEGVEIFNGTLPTLNQPLPSLPDSSPITVIDLFSWGEEVSFAGTRSLEIFVTGATLLLTDTLANYYPISTPTTPPASPIPSTSSGPDDFGWVSFIMDNDIVVSDPLSDVSINGKTVSADLGTGYYGQWYWRVPTGSLFNATVTVMQGVE